MKTIVFVFFMFCVFLVYNVGAQSAATTMPDYSVVLGTFSVQSNAARFTKYVKQQKLEPSIQLNEKSNVYYVYVLGTSDHTAAIELAKKYQASGKFKDAWVFNRIPPPPVVIEPEPVIIEEKPIEVIVPVIVKPTKLSAEDSAKLAGDKIKAEVAKKIMSTKQGTMEKLDYIFFYRDASVLRPESRYAVDELVQLMKDNPGVIIRIHGHTNGNDPGKIIKRSAESSDFFSLDNTVEDYGSAKELSQQRAEQILDYLVVHGIDKKRISIKAWGGKKPLFNVDDDKAEANVRVEIEVVKN
jgi:outer membrane protein OmpA-like peptidoglycan-associated protein